MTRYYKAVQPDGTDFFSGTVRWLPADGIIPPEGWLVTHPTAERVGTEADTYLSVSTVTTDCTGMTWPCRLLLVEPAGSQVRTPEPYGLPRKRASVAWRVVAELPAHEALGPQGAEVAAIIERARRLTPDELGRMRENVGDAARDATRYAARFAARHATRYAAWDAARDAAWDAARDAVSLAAWDAAARGAAWLSEAFVVVRDATLATLIHDLITDEQYNILTGSWRAGLETS